jgi:hypothetical protein
MLLAATAGCGHSPAAFKQTTKSVATVPLTTQPLPTLPTTTTSTVPLAPTTITLTVTGSGTALSITVLDGTDESQHNDEALPFTTTITGAVPPVVGIGAQASGGSSSTTIGCEIEISAPGVPSNPAGGPPQVLTTNSSTGPYAVVDCTTDPLAAPGF